MHRAQILIEEWQYDTLRAEAEREGKSISEIVRAILTSRYHRRPRKTRLSAMTGIVSDPNTSGAGHDAYLYGAKQR
jgi:hypothetical protein